MASGVADLTCTRIMGRYTRFVSRSAPGLLPLFRSEAQLALLGQLFLHPDHEQTMAELQQSTGVPQQTVSREVGRLLNSGLLVGRRVGRLHFVRPNEASPYFPELSGLLLKALGPQSLLADSLRKLEGVEEAYLFGSWARRYQGQIGPPPGDIDLVVIGEPDVDAVYDAAAEVARLLGQDVNPVVLAPADWRVPRSGFVKELRQGPLVPLVTGYKDD
jgi:predicted nucleotidyltransferase